MKTMLFAAAFTAIIVTTADKYVPTIAAGGLLHPAKRTSLAAMPPQCAEREFAGSGVTLRGWSCGADGARRGTIVYLHGIADNRGSGVGTIRRFTAQGFDVVAYDSRGHGLSEGEICTYGHFEKADLGRVMDTLVEGPVILIGTSLGAAVALQAAALDARVSGVIAAEAFSDLETVARDRAPVFLTDRIIRKAFVIAEERGSFRIRDVSPVEAARHIRVPVLLVHGAADTETAPAHSVRVFDALAGPKRLILVEGAGHNRSLSGTQVWAEIDAWLASAPWAKQ